MSEMDPELKRLLHWARQAGPLQPEQCPRGFAQRVAQRWCSLEAHDTLGMWQRAILGSVWPATAVLLVGLAILMVQRFAANSSYDLSPAYQLVSVQMVP